MAPCGDVIYSSLTMKFFNSLFLEGRGPPQLTRDRDHQVGVAIAHGQLGKEPSRTHQRSSSGGGCPWHDRSGGPLGWMYCCADGAPVAGVWLTSESQRKREWSDVVGGEV